MDKTMNENFLLIIGESKILDIPNLDAFVKDRSAY